MLIEQQIVVVSNGFNLLVFLMAETCDFHEGGNSELSGVDNKNQLDVTFCILYFSSNSCSTCFGQPCAHHQEMTTA